MKFNDQDLRICLVAYALTAASLAWGHKSGPEFIEAFDTELSLHASGQMNVSHVIEVHPHGDEIRRGIFFELPGDVGPLSDYSLTLDGRPLEPEVEDDTIIVAAAEPLAVHASHRFVLQYRARAPLWREPGGTARLRWRPIIEQFELAWRSASLSVAWPADIQPLELPEAGEREGRSWQLTMRGPASGGAESGLPGIVEWRWAAEAFPQSALRRPGVDWGWRTLLGLGILVLLGLLHTAWRAVGRDPDLGHVASRNTPPDGISPAAARFIERMGFDETAFVAALVSLKVKQAVEVSVDEEGEKLSVRRRDPLPAALSPGEKALLDTWFGDGASSIELAAGDERGAAAMTALSKRLGREHRGRYFVTNTRQRVLGMVGGLALAALGLGALIAQASDDMTRDFAVIGLGVAALVTGIFAPLIYFELFKAPTRAGLEVKRQIAGLKHYLENSSAPVRDARHFIELLPYAIALDAEEAWRERFEGGDETELECGVDEALAWYREIRRRHESVAAIVPVIAAASGASAATSAGASGGASAGGV